MFLSIINVTIFPGTCDFLLSEAAYISSLSGASRYIFSASSAVRGGGFAAS